MNSFTGWIGGKKLLRKEIISRFPQTKVERYVEVFGGAGWVLFGKEVIPGQLEVFNDINGNLINLYRVIKYHCDALQKELDLLPHSRELFFDYLQGVDIRGLTDIQRAARYFYLIRVSFGNDVRSFATGLPDRKGMSEKSIRYLSEIQSRLKNVVIENIDFASLIKAYDRPNSLFYLDPPYDCGKRCYNGYDFDEDAHRRLLQAVQGIKGYFILSYNDNEFIRELYRSYNIEEVERTNNLSSKNTVYRELIIRNY